jgi:arsenate reductase
MADSITVLEYPRCGTCKKALKWLSDHAVVYEDRHIVEHNPTRDELKGWIEASGLPIRRFFNTSGRLYRELNMKDRFKDGISEDECLDLLASDGMLVKRPLVVAPDFVLVGFKEAEWEEKLA